MTAEAGDHEASASAVRRPARRRPRALALLAAVVACGLGVHALLADTAATDISGDALYAAAAYLAVVLVAPHWSPFVVAGVAGAWCVAVELFQLTGIPIALGAVFPPAMLVLGTVFDARDLLVYVVAVAACAAIDTALARIRSRR
ncbi:hypothetical protein JOD63_001607 [Microbacterium terrae]|uniref:DUF2809 domain-containing protein n=1 Tax=Microbacterium terrae TaxID=69369 RepID=A0A0M2HAW9_9MICO|nr:DUF2809 domain-containing protein [Microbacterium terrae]KJL41323.1 hypothetical protein RS81_01391 [Microbacterium terrae]MBP1077639.1 hypothetical protein [Microbacterium terrae]GLJ99244.1 hypothetical protein GCM10017594_24410 [Microbacterium terrae]